MPKDADFIAVGADGLKNLVIDQNRRDRQISGRQSLRHSHHIGFQVIGFRREHITCATKPANHFIGDKQDVVFFQNHLNFFKISSWRHDHAPGAHNWLSDKRCHGFRSLIKYLLLKTGRHAGCKIFFAFAIKAEFIVMRAIGVPNVGDWQIKIHMIGR